MPARSEPLHLHEEIMLLALRDQKGTIELGSNYRYALGGALLAELLMSHRIRVEGKRNLVTLTSDEPLGEPLLDESLERIARAKRRSSMESWVSKLTGLKDLHHRVAARLCERGILRLDEDKILLLFKRTIYPEIDPRPERELIERMRGAIFNDADHVDPRTAVAISLAQAADLLRIPFEKRDLRQRKKRIEQITSGEVTGKAAREAIEAMQAAVMVACIIPAAAATTVAT